MLVKTNREEQGQILVILAVGLVVLLGFTALAVDGSMAYSDRRHTQNAADAGALAGALALAEHYDEDLIAREDAIIEDAETSICANDLGDEDFSISCADTDSDGNTDVDVYYPPNSGPHQGDTDFVQVVITNTVKTSLIHFVYPGIVKNTVESVTEVVPSEPIYVGNTIVGLDEDDKDTVKLGGSTSLNIIGGGVYSNSDHNKMSAVKDGGITVSIYTDDTKTTEGSIAAVGEFKDNGSSGELNANIVEGSPHLGKISIPIPDCEELEDDWGDPKYNDDESSTMEPGRYTGLTISKGIVTMEPGLYCFTGNISITGGELNGDGVMIFMDEGGISMNGGGIAKLYASDDLLLKSTSGSNYQYAGMLIYSNPDNSSIITLNGGSDTTFEGTILNQGGDCAVEGNAENLDYVTQVICNTVKINGGPNMDIFYDKEKLFNLPSALNHVQ